MIRPDLSTGPNAVSEAIAPSTLAFEPYQSPNIGEDLSRVPLNEELGQETMTALISSSLDFVAVHEFAGNQVPVEEHINVTGTEWGKRVVEQARKLDVIALERDLLCEREDRTLEWRLDRLAISASLGQWDC